MSQSHMSHQLQSFVIGVEIISPLAQQTQEVEYIQSRIQVAAEEIRRFRI